MPFLFLLFFIKEKSRLATALIYWITVWGLPV